MHFFSHSTSLLLSATTIIILVLQCGLTTYASLDAPPYRAMRAVARQDIPLVNSIGTRHLSTANSKRMIKRKGMNARQTTSIKIQHSNLSLPSTAKGAQSRVKRIFQDSYAAYKEFAFGHDELHPVSLKPGDSRNGWGATIVDSLSTMYIMDLQDELDEAISFASNINWANTSDLVSVFETTIRYMGGLLSTYELMERTNEQLLNQTKVLADMLSAAWTTSDMPYSHLNFSTMEPAKTTSNIAEVGTLILEWSTLSKYTSNKTYSSLAEKAVKRVISFADNPNFLGLPPQNLDIENDNPIGSHRSWGGGSDSYYEYLIKYPRLSNTDDKIYTAAWLVAVDSSIKKMLQVSKTGDSYLAELNGNDTNPVGSHLACFHGGNWIYGGKLLGNDSIVEVGLRLVDGCWNMYAATSSGIGPESVNYALANTSFFSKHGFTITSSGYVLRPEVIESNFYAWRLTGDTKYYERALLVLEAFERNLAAPATRRNGSFIGLAYAGLADVNSGRVKHVDVTPSFWFAEVLKYLFLTFDDPGRISLDDYVFNTEAHPFRAPTAKASYLPI